MPSSTVIPKDCWVLVIWSKPLALQLGDLIQENWPGQRKSVNPWVSEVNLNVGCPSDRVQQGRFGVCLMAEPNLVADCISEMIGNVEIPVTVKTRIGVDEQDSFEFLAGFVDRVSRAGCQKFIVHARKAWLQGLSPKQNRQVPPLDYQRVYRLKREFPDLDVVINGGILDLEAVDQHLGQVDGVMLGRAAYHNAYILSEVDRRYFGSESAPRSRTEVVLGMEAYVSEILNQKVPLKRLSRHMMGLFQGVPGARSWRRYLSEHAIKPNAGFEVLLQALDQLSIETIRHRSLST